MHYLKLQLDSFKIICSETSRIKKSCQGQSRISSSVQNANFERFINVLRIHVFANFPNSVSEQKHSRHRCVEKNLEKA